MCVDSVCTPIDEFPESCACNERGVCNQKDECHCDDGWAPPSCAKVGRGGSLSSGQAEKEFDLTLFTSELMYYICVGLI